MGERVLCKHEVIGSIPFSSTNSGEHLTVLRSAESARKRSADKRACVLER